MSHVSKIELEIKDLNSLIAACKHLGLTFIKNQKSYKWYGRIVNPDLHPLPEGVTGKDLGNCDHAIQIPEANYEIGVIFRNGKYLLLCDFWDRGVEKKIGKNGGKLKQAYAIAQIMAQARKKHLKVSENSIENGIRLILKK